MWSSSQQSFFIPSPTLLNPKFRNSRKTVVVHCSCSQPQPDNQQQQQQSPAPLRLGKLALIAMAASVLKYGSVHDASAAKTGGRIGGQAFKSAAPRNSAPRINNNNSRSKCIMPDYDDVFGLSLCSFFGLIVAEAIGGVFAYIFLLMLLAAVAAVVWRLIRLHTSVYAS